MTTTLKNIEDPRISEMLDVIFRFAAGDLKARGTVSEEDSALDAVMAGINILGEELEAQVAETKQAENALRAQEKNYRLLFESSRDALMTLAPPSWRFTSANQATLELFGAASTTAFTELGPWDVSPERQPDGRPSDEKAQEMIATAMREGKVAFEWEHQRLDGSTFPADVLATRMDVEGNVFLQATVRDITERKRAERALSESEGLIRTIFDSVQDGILMADAQTRRFRMANAAMCRMLGYSLDELLNLGMEDIHREEDIASVVRQFERMSKGETGVAQNLPVKRKDGTVFYADLNTGPMMVNGIACLVGVFRDITERKRSEQALRESEEMLRTIASSAQDAIVMVNNDGNIALWNAAATKIFGHSSEEALGENMHLLLAPARFHEAYRTGFRHFRSTGEGAVIGKTLELAALRKDGREFPIELSLSAVKLRGKWSAVGIMRDITERKLQEQSLRDSEERFKSILENVVEMFFIADASLHAEYVSPRCLEIYGYSGDELIARPTLWMEAIHPEDRGELMKRVAEELRSGARAVSEYRIIRKDGSVRWVRSASNAVLGTDGKLQRVYGTVTDITEFETLRSSLNEKEVLLKEIHHRVKNNLQIVISLMRLESRAFHEEKISAALKDLETRIRAMALVHEHLYHSSDLAKIGFKDYLKGLCEELFRTYGADGGRIRLAIDAEAVALDIERAIPCGLIINELLTNAIKYAFPGNRKGVLRVAIRNTPDSGVEIVVSDDGIGIPETLDIRHAKTLGLQLVTTLTENQLKGTVELERAGGTRFRIRFGI